MTHVVVAPAGPDGLQGRIRVPGDKSVSHRALLLSARAAGRSVITGLSDGTDVAATRRAMEAYGATVTAGEAAGEWVVEGGSLHEPESVVDVGNSGTAIRLLAGWAAGIDGLSVLYGDRSIAGRPMGRVVEPLRLMGAHVDGRDGGRLPPLAVRGGHLRPIDFEVPVASAQVKGAVLLAGLAADGPTTVREALATRTHTEQMLAWCGLRVDIAPGAVTVHPGPLRPGRFEVPGDPSQAAFWVVAACITPGSDVTVEGVYLGPQRAGFVDVLTRMGADVEISGLDSGTSVGDIRARYAPLNATTVGGAEIPGLIDEIPVLAVAAAYAAGVTTFADAAELKVKESDRIATTVAALRAIGAPADPRPDGLSVEGGAGRQLAGGAVSSAGDHRVAMAMAVTALPAAGPVDIDGFDAVATSYPTFEEDLHRCRAHHLS